MNVKIKQELNFVVDDSRLFLDAQEAKKVSKCTLDPTCNKYCDLIG